MTLGEGNTPPIITLDWLVANRGEVTLVDCRAYLDERDGYANYLAGHIPGSVFVEMDSVFAGSPAPIVGRHPLPDPAAFARGLETVGINELATVVAYDDAGGMIAGRLVWMLRALGQGAALLDGGIQGWIDHPATGALEVGTPSDNAHTIMATRCAVRQFPSELLASADEVAAHVERGGILADSRGRTRYLGEEEPIDAKAGHIPGSISLPFAENLTEDGHFLPMDELARRFGVNKVDGNAIFYCGSGVSACNNLLAIEAAGLGQPRLYVGSWSGWTSDPARPIATGPQSWGD